MKTYNEVYLGVRSILRQRGVEDYSLEARLIVSKAAGKTVAELLRDLNLYTSEEIAGRSFDYAARRLRGEPIAYIAGSWEFYGLPMIVNDSVLIPRPDTEVIVDAVKELVTGWRMDARILDLCCGSGCIACALGHELPASRIVAADVSTDALDVCKKNLRLNRLTARIIPLQADALSSPPCSTGSFDVIVSNPPYIRTDEIPTLESSVKDYEPLIALDGGEDGLKFYRAIIKYWKVLLREGGCIVFEVGEEQAGPVCEMLESAGFRETYTRTDAAGTERVVVGRL